MNLDEKNIYKEIELKQKDLQHAKLDMSFSELSIMYVEGDLVINPEFMKLYNWNNYQKTRLIESILMKIPIPPLYVVENEIGTWELVDGIQRLCTVLSFMGKLGSENKWRLDEGNILKKIKDQTFDDLPLKARNLIKRSGCRVEIIYYDKDYIRDEMYDIFNTHPTRLSDVKINQVLNDIKIHNNGEVQ